MTNHFEDYEAEAFENAGCEARMLPEDREALQSALSGALEIFVAPGEAGPNYVHAVIETLDEFPPYFSDTRICDGIGEVIELLHEILDERVLDFEDAQDGKRAVESIAETLGIEVPEHDI